MPARFRWNLTEPSVPGPEGSGEFAVGSPDSRRHQFEQMPVGVAEIEAPAAAVPLHPALHGDAGPFQLLLPGRQLGLVDREGEAARHGGELVAAFLQLGDDAAGGKDQRHGHRQGLDHDVEEGQGCQLGAVEMEKKMNQGRHDHRQRGKDDGAPGRTHGAQAALEPSPYGWRTGNGQSP